MQPRELQEITRRGLVRLNVEGVDDEQQLDWQVEYKKFDSSRYSKSALLRPRIVGGENEVTGSFQATREGDYRIRVRSKETGSRWSAWRLFHVGKPAVARLVEKPLKPSVQKTLDSNSSAPNAKKQARDKPKNLKPTGLNRKPITIKDSLIK